MRLHGLLVGLALSALFWVALGFAITFLLATR